jgi:hypothetical protein
MTTGDNLNFMTPSLCQTWSEAELVDRKRGGCPARSPEKERIGIFGNIVVRQIEQVNERCALEISFHGSEHSTNHIEYVNLVVVSVAGKRLLDDAPG